MFWNKWTATPVDVDRREQLLLDGGCSVVVLAQARIVSTSSLRVM
jgi:hypothetical protein